jgi:hypothetical protein
MVETNEKIIFKFNDDEQFTTLLLLVLLLIFIGHNQKIVKKVQHEELCIIKTVIL